jgi:hypothetical protein
MNRDGSGIELAATRRVCFSMSMCFCSHKNDDEHYLFPGDVIRYTYHLSSGEYDYQYQLGQNAAQDSTPRGATIPENIAVLPSTSTNHSREYYKNHDYDYQHPSQTSNEVDDLSGEFADTSLNDAQLPSTDSASHDGYHPNEGQQGRFPSRVTSRHSVGIS